jgi:hypothetical protein
VHGLRALGALMLAVSILVGPIGSRPASGAELRSADIGVSVIAFLDGKPLAIKLVANYSCDDFSYPVITCSTQAIEVEARASLALLAGVDYVTIWDQSNFGGGSMNVSQDYATLITIGWNDKVSSFKARNSETGRFTVDWFFGGANWSFCCNSQVTTLNAYDNTFSAVQRT